MARSAPVSIAEVRNFLEAEPVGFFALLCGIVALVFRLSETKLLAKVFAVLPTVFWIYFVPMVLATFGFFPEKSPVYSLLTDYFLPTSLLLLFLSASLPEILKLGPRTIGVMLIGTAGVILGAATGVLALLPFFKSGVLPAEHLESLWKGVAALSGSWTGGSANLAAIWQSLTGNAQTESEGQIFAAIIAVDVCIGYSWMALLIALAGQQAGINRWLRADSSRIEEVNHRMAAVTQAEARPTATGKVLYMLALAFGVAFVCKWFGTQAQAAFEAQVQSPLWRSVLGYYGIMIILVTIAGLGLSVTPVARLEVYGASKIGYALLYLVLARIGAKGDLNAIREFPAYLLMGVVWMLTHGGLLLLAAKGLRVPVFFAATASQANVGGPVSAPVVAAAYQPGLAVVGLLMAILGGVLGTFSGLFVVAPMVHWLTSLVR
ncbi:MAG: DUF819 family protein [Verrucomicrobia bacterium]|nr:DUF819 family protein [Verrucomicrobiota bacterium]